MKPRFVVLVINNQELQSVFDDVAHEFGVKVKKPHITIRGPYKSTVRKSTIESVNSGVDKVRSIELEGVGLFQGANASAVYIAVTGSDLRARSIWWKPDYLIKDHGFNPHVTVFEGEHELARNIYNYLELRKIKITVNDFQVSQITSISSKQLSWLS